MRARRLPNEIKKRARSRFFLKKKMVRVRGYRWILIVSVSVFGLWFAYVYKMCVGRSAGKI